jgi:hypothetical protein
MKIPCKLEDVMAHGALRNPVLEGAASGFTPAARSIVLSNYRVFTAAFPAILAGLIARMTRMELIPIQFWLTQILYSELGSGRLPGAHPNLFDELCRGAGASLDPTPTAGITLVSGLRHLYLDEDLIVSLGAQLALELQAGHMLAKLSKAFTGPGGERDIPQFFLVHQQDEPEHERAMVACMEDIDGDPALLRRGFEDCLEAFAIFWHDVDAAIRGTHSQVVRGRPT